MHTLQLISFRIERGKYLLKRKLSHYIKILIER